MRSPVAVFARVCELGESMGWENITMDPGCKEHQIDSDWWFALNPHRHPEACSRGMEVPSMQIYFEWKGLPAGFVGYMGGTLICSRRVNEDTLMAALDAAIARVEKGDPNGCAAIKN